jgi:lactoylglutathione lyase
MFKKQTPNIMVMDIAQTIGFYQDVLGFAVVVTMPPEGAPLVWAMVQRDGVELMFQQQDSLAEEMPLFGDMPVGASLSLYMEIDDVQGMADTLKGRVEIVRDVHTTFYGMREFAFKDCNGYILVYAEQVSQSS